MSVLSLAIITAATAQINSISEKKGTKVEKKALKHLNGNTVSSQSKAQFKADFGNITTVQWKRSATFDEATFKKGNETTTAFYDDKAMLVGTTAPKSFTDLPAKAQKYINDKYKDYNKSAVIFFDDNEKNETDMILFEQQFDDVDSYFVELKKDKKDIVLEVSMQGDVSYFRDLR